MSEATPFDRLMTGKSWEAFCDALKAAGQTILAEGQPDDPLDRAEGFRYLTRLTRASLEAFVEYADPLAPVLNRPVHETAKIGADNPDNYYQHAVISGECEYRIRGVRNTVHYLDFGTQSEGVASTGESRQAGHLDAKDLEIGPDGRFEILLSCEEKPGNWLRMTPETTQLIVRQTFLDRDTEKPADLVIERIGGDGKPATLTPEALDAGLQRAQGLVVGCAALFSTWAKGFQAHTNELPKFDDSISMGAGGDPNICYYHSYWSLGPEEALVIEVTPPECDSWNFQLDNHWMESLDYRYYRIHVNKHTATYEPDGSVRIVVAHEDPGVPNWIHTVGHRQGTMCFRWIRAEEHPQPRTRVVKRSELAGGGR
ncbi:MAG: DUF1214 domain-containing protein [Spirochaetaceae bacterium]|nr:DUF1214 domain-containing protein [Myxococcales bacterium]MCB9726461.1 DUF1214 domain-containing protein [Spirochaetaceae bacterium]